MIVTTSKREERPCKHRSINIKVDTGMCVGTVAKQRLPLGTDNE